MDHLKSEEFMTPIQVVEKEILTSAFFVDLLPPIGVAHELRALRMQGKGTRR